MVLGKLPVPGRPTSWIIVGQGPTALAVGAGGGCLDIFTLLYPFSPLSPSLWETARYRLKYCLKGPLNPKQPINQLFRRLRNFCWVFWHSSFLWQCGGLGSKTIWYIVSLPYLLKLLRFLPEKMYMRKALSDYMRKKSLRFFLFWRSYAPFYLLYNNFNIRFAAASYLLNQKVFYINVMCYQRMCREEEP